MLISEWYLPCSLHCSRAHSRAVQQTAQSNNKY